MIGGGSRGDAFCFPREHAGIIDRQFRAAIMDRQNNGGGNFDRIRHVIRGFPSESGSVRSLIDRSRFSGTIGSVRNRNDPFHSLRGSRLQTVAASTFGGRMPGDVTRTVTLAVDDSGGLRH